MRAVKHQKASASLRMTYRMGDARSDMPCSIPSKYILTFSLYMMVQYHTSKLVRQF